MIDERAAEVEAAKNKQYAAIGKFVVTFEALCFKLRPLFAQSLHKHGLQAGGQTIANIAVENTHVAAAALKDIVAAAYCEAMRHDKTAVAVMSDLQRRFNKLIERRNDIVHGTWLIGFHPDETDLSKMVGIRPSISTKGFKYKMLPKDADELDGLSVEASYLADVVDYLRVILIMSDQKGDDYFISERGKWSIRPNFRNGDNGEPAS